MNFYFNFFLNKQKIYTLKWLVLYRVERAHSLTFMSIALLSGLLLCDCVCSRASHHVYMSCLVVKLDVICVSCQVYYLSFAWHNELKFCQRLKKIQHGLFCRNSMQLFTNTTRKKIIEKHSTMSSYRLVSYSQLFFFSGHLV